MPAAAKPMTSAKTGSRDLLAVYTIRAGLIKAGEKVAIGGQ